MPEERSQGDNSAGDRAVTPDRGTADHTMSCPACSATYPPDTRFCPLDGSILRPIATDGDLVGTILDERYCLLEKLGQGGMGEVYLGEHVLTRRRCAVKVVSRTLAADPDAFGRFVREATNAGQINNPHVATIYDFGKTDDGLLYLAMEYVDGESIASLLEREGALAPARAVDIAQQVAEAVGAAHEQGIVHRDLKPGNILVAPDRKGGEQVKVVDFGIARATADEQQRLTRTGFVIGTPEYMSPEQLIGDPVDARADIYALGCILYQMLTGHRAFEGSTAHLITRRLTERPPRPRDTNRAIPKALDEVVVTALGRMPEDRYQTMEELRSALLAAPSQPVTTGPGRLAAWLGLKGGRDQQNGDQVAATLTSPDAEAAAEQSVADVAADVVAAEQLVETPISDERASAPVSADSAAADAVLEAGVVPADPEATAAAPRNSILSRIGAGVAAVVALLVAVLALRAPGGESDEVVAPPLVDTGPTTRAVSPLVPDSVLAYARSDLVAAAFEMEAGQYVAAIHRLHGVESRLANLAATFPQRTDVQIVADSVRAQLELIERRCNALKKLAAERNEPAPVCEVS